MFNPDFRDMLSVLNDANAEYMLVGAYAVAAHGMPRATGDIDIWVRPSVENASRVWAGLCKFGASLAIVTKDDFHTPGTVYSLGVPPRQIKILTSVSGVEFEDALRNRTSYAFDDVTAPVIGRNELIANKRAAGRSKDKVDLTWLEVNQ